MAVFARSRSPAEIAEILSSVGGLPEDDPVQGCSKQSGTGVPESVVSYMNIVKNLFLYGWLSISPGQPKMAHLRNSSKREGNNLSELNRPTHLDILPEFEEDSLGLARIARWIDLADQALDVDQPLRKRA